MDRTLERLGTDYIDLLLIHQPAGNYSAGYRQMEKAYQEGNMRPSRKTASPYIFLWRRTMNITARNGPEPPMTDLRAAYQNAGWSEEEIEGVLQVEIPDNDYFSQRGITGNYTEEPIFCLRMTRSCSGFFPTEKLLHLKKYAEANIIIHRPQGDRGSFPDGRKNLIEKGGRSCLCIIRSLKHSSAWQIQEALTKRLKNCIYHLRRLSSRLTFWKKAWICSCLCAPTGALR